MTLQKTSEQKSNDASSSEQKHEDVKLNDEANENIVLKTSEKLGYAATVAWLPSLLLNGAFFRGDFAELCTGLPESWTLLNDIVPAAFCLLLCVVFGIVLMIFADKFSKSVHFIRLWAVAICCTVIALCIPNDIVDAILLAASYTIARLMWKTHLINKMFDSDTLLIATLLCGCILFLSSLLDETATSFALYFLLMVSLCLYLAVYTATYKDWVFVPRQAMRAKGFTAAQKLFTATGKTMTGIAFGSLIYTCSYHLSLIVAGIVWLASACAVWLLNRREKKLSKSSTRGYFLLGSVLALVMMPTLPDAGRIVGAGVLSIFAVTSALSNSIRHYVVEKDLGLSDVYLFGFRHSTNSIGMLVGYVATYGIFAFFTPPSSVAFGFFGLVILFVLIVTLVSLGVFESRRERIPTTSIADPWHEKVTLLAKEYSLTNRQTEIFDALSRGRNAKYIMQRLYLSEGTVKKQVFQIYKRMGVHTQQDLITLVMTTDLE